MSCEVQEKEKIYPVYQFDTTISCHTRAVAGLNSIFEDTNFR